MNWPPIIAVQINITVFVLPVPYIMHSLALSDSFTAEHKKTLYKFYVN